MMKKHTSRSTLGLFACLIVAAAGISACGDDGSAIEIEPRVSNDNSQDSNTGKADGKDGTPFTVVGVDACAAAVDYTCETTTQQIAAGADFYAVVALEAVSVDHRYKVEAYRDGELVAEEMSPMHTVEEVLPRSGFSYAVNAAAAGEWEFKFSLEAGDVTELGVVKVSVTP